MKICPYSAEREKIVAAALAPVASELRMIDAADLISILKFERYATLQDLVASAAELFFLPGTVTLGIGGDYHLDWDVRPSVTLDLELKPEGVCVYLRLLLEESVAGIEINHISFDAPDSDPDINTEFLRTALARASFRPAPMLPEAAAPVYSA